MERGEIEEVYYQIGFQIPYEHQKECYKKILENKNIILDVGTASGKTESTLVPLFQKSKENNLRIILIYPTKALIEDQKKRIDEIIRKIRLNYRAEIDTGDETDKFCYRANILLTTIDKFLYRVFGYGNARWGFIYPWRIVFNQNYKTVLVFDEAHLYDGISLAHFLFLLEKLTYENNLQTIVLSATLPTEFKTYLETNFAFEVIPEGNDVKKGKQVYRGHIEKNDIQSKIIEAFSKNKRVIVVANRVYGDENSVKSLWEKLNTGLIDHLFVYHGHQFPDQRKRTLEEIISIDNSWKENKTGKPFVLLTTSAFEVGVDISCDIMLTEVCMPDSFIQRIGRCGRREGEVGDVYTFGDVERQHSEKDREKIKKLLDILRENENNEINSEIKNNINKLNVVDRLFESYKRTLPYAMDNALYSYIYDFVPTSAEVWDKGILVTRGWIPTLEIEYRNERLRLPVIHSIPPSMIADWWLEYRDLYGKIKRTKEVNDLGKNGVVVRSVSVQETKNNKKRNIEECIHGPQATLVLKLVDRDENFGLEYRINTEVKYGYGGIGLRIGVASINVNDAVMNLFWYEPEGE